MGKCVGLLLAVSDGEIDGDETGAPDGSLEGNRVGETDG